MKQLRGGTVSGRDDSGEGVVQHLGDGEGN